MNACLQQILMQIIQAGTLNLKGGKRKQVTRHHRLLDSRQNPRLRTAFGGQGAIARSAILPVVVRKAPFLMEIDQSGCGASDKLSLTLAAQDYAYGVDDVYSRTKARFYRAVVRSTLLYECDTWPLNVAGDRRLRSSGKNISDASFVILVANVPVL